MSRRALSGHEKALGKEHPETLTLPYTLEERHVKSEILGANAEKGILVGFEGNSVYRLYIPTRVHKIVRSSHVIFLEDDNDIDEELDVVV